MILDPEEKRFIIALSLVNGVGNAAAKTLYSYCGSAKEIFKTSLKKLSLIPGIGMTAAQKIKQFDEWGMVEKELSFIDRHEIQILHYTNPDYPRRLLQIDSCPFLIYLKGQVNLNPERSIAIIGTRSPTVPGEEWTRDFVSKLKDNKIHILSGFAFGIDITAHKAAVANEIPTYAVLGGGLDNIYPAAHKPFVKEIIKQGGIISESPSFAKPDRQRFPMRNRLVAGMADAVIVVESPEQGGSMITAEFANTYHKDVFAVPGSPNDHKSKGCNLLIKSNKAGLIEDAADLLEFMNWEEDKATPTQTQLFRAYSEQEQSILDILTRERTIHFDALAHQLYLKSSELSALLFNLEMDGVINKLPGNQISRR